MRLEDGWADAVPRNVISMELRDDIEENVGTVWRDTSTTRFYDREAGESHFNNVRTKSARGQNVAKRFLSRAR